MSLVSSNHLFLSPLCIATPFPTYPIFECQYWAVCSLFEKGVVAILGPRNPAISRSIRSLSNHFGLPYLEIHWALSAPEGSYAINVHPHHYAFGIGLFEYISQGEKWKKMTIIYSRRDSKSSYHSPIATI
ncbi:unnamed protein product [Protopolystoma xenopodis]|uniref:Receptor ligand binding region domain-containing protein n=1 Tax=Protopolystoma xenopodis TaxID=117903 RepID=A0A448XM23_9PLAT|nr:unnamed protein product [Protopolystoma xenopodis]